jgi:glycosyltransferase involved in cell wall biosynthesis
MKYSVVIPAYNAQETIKECLKSVVAQTMSPSQIIVVDDGSQDDTAKIVGEYSEFVSLIRQENNGPGRATTKGFSHATSPLIATLDADDLWLPDKAEIQLMHLQQNRELDGVFSHIQSFSKSSAKVSIEQGWLRSTMMIRTKAQQKIGDMIDPKPYGGEFIGWIGRAREMGCQFDMLPVCLALRRIRQGSLSYGRSEPLVSGYLQIARESILRKKQNKQTRSKP